MRSSKSLLQLAKAAFLLLMIFFFTIPIVWMFLTSFKTMREALSVPPIFFFVPTLQNYIDVMYKLGFLDHMKNSLILSFSATAITLLLGALAGYAAVRFDIKNKGTIMWGFFLGRLLPPVVFAVPIYALFLLLRIIDTYPGMISVYVLLNIPFAVWLMASYVTQLPPDLEESAMVDGCTTTSAFLRIVLPLCAPVISAIAIFSFITCWNEFLLTYILTGSTTKTMTVFISTFIGQYTVAWDTMSACGMILIAPPIILSWLMQKWIIRGLTLGAVKG